MSNDISVAKTELFLKLHKQYKEVVGASVRSDSGDKYIVILLSHLTHRIKSHLPINFKGNRVEHEVVGSIDAV